MWTFTIICKLKISTQLEIYEANNIYPNSPAQDWGKRLMSTCDRQVS